MQETAQNNSTRPAFTDLTKILANLSMCIVGFVAVHFIRDFGEFKKQVGEDVKDLIKVSTQIQTTQEYFLTDLRAIKEDQKALTDRIRALESQ